MGRFPSARHPTKAPFLHITALTIARDRESPAVPDEYRLNGFLAAKDAAQARRQEAVREAHERFGRVYLVEKARHAAEYERASALWDALKMNPKADGYDEAWRQFQLAKQPPNHDQARAELHRAIRAADEAYHAELIRLSQENGLAGS